jgi:hypothetical protein
MYSASRNIPVPNIHKILSQQGYSSQNIRSGGIYVSTKYSVSMDVPVQSVRSVGMFQYKTGK